MKTINRVLAIIILLALTAVPAFAESPMAAYPETVGGASQMTSLSLASDAATIVGTLPSGMRSFVAKAVGCDVNFGGSTVSTGTNHLYIPNGESRWFGYFHTPTPTIYFRPRGTAGLTGTLLLLAGPKVETFDANTEANSGFVAMTDLSLATAAATIAGTVPYGCKSFIAIAEDADVNFGDATVSTATTHPYIPHGESRQFSGLTSQSPTIYFRVRGTSTETTDLRLDAGPQVSNPNGD